MPGVGSRSRRFSSPHPLRGSGGRQNTKSCVFLASSVTPGGTDEQQTATIGGTPTGGTFTLTFRGATTTALAFNAAATAVEDALESLSTVGPGNVRVTGGPGPGTPYTVRFHGDLGRQDIELMTASGASLTGGTSPGVTIATSVAGSNVDAGRLIVRRGTIVMAAPGDATKTVAWDGASATTPMGVLAQDWEFMDNTARSNTDLSYWGGPNCDFLSKNLTGFTGNEANFRTWVQAHGCVITEGAV